MFNFLKKRPTRKEVIAECNRLDNQIAEDRAGSTALQHKLTREITGLRHARCIDNDAYCGLQTLYKHGQATLRKVCGELDEAYKELKESKGAFELLNDTHTITATLLDDQRVLRRKAEERAGVAERELASLQFVNEVGGEALDEQAQSIEDLGELYEHAQQVFVTDNFKGYAPYGEDWTALVLKGDDSYVEGGPAWTMSISVYSDGELTYMADLSFTSKSARDDAFDLMDFDNVKRFADDPEGCFVVNDGEVDLEGTYSED